MSREFLRNLAVMIGVMVSGLGLSLIFVVRTTLIELLMLCVAPLVAVMILPRKQWLRAAAFVFLFGSVFGVGRVIAGVGRSVLQDLPSGSSGEGYAYELALYTIYGLIWVLWWWLEGRPPGSDSIKS